MNFHNDSFYKLTPGDQIVQQTTKELSTSTTISPFIPTSKIVPTDNVPTMTNNVENGKLVGKLVLKK